MQKPRPIDRRKYPRILTDALIAIRPVADLATLAQGLDLGVGGIRFQCVGLELELGDCIEVTFDLGGESAIVVGRTVRVTDLDAFTQEIGLAFAKIDPEIIERFYEAGLIEED